MKPKVNGHQGRAKIHSRAMRDERRERAAIRAEAYANRSPQEQLDLAKSRRGNSAKEIARLEAQLAAQSE